MNDLMKPVQRLGHFWPFFLWGIYCLLEEVTSYVASSTKKIHSTHLCTSTHTWAHLHTPTQTRVHPLTITHTSTYTWAHPRTSAHKPGMSRTYPCTPAYTPQIPTDAINLINHMKLYINRPNTKKARR